MAMLLRCKKETTLLLFLKEELPDWRPRTIKERLRRHCIQVNGEAVTHHAFALHSGDEIAIHKSPVILTELKNGIRILYQDQSLIGIYKPAGLLSVGTDRVRSKHALAVVREALGPNQKLWPVHRLDRETSGILLFARSREICDLVQRTWSDVEKVYVAVVQGQLLPKDGIVDQPLVEDDHLRVKVRSQNGSKEARTRYRTLDVGPSRSLVEIHLETGRRHQIRVHMAWKGNPVVGDPRYGKKASRMALHALNLSFSHPITGKNIELKTTIPPVFAKLLG